MTLLKVLYGESYQLVTHWATVHEQFVTALNLNTELLISTCNGALGGRDR